MELQDKLKVSGINNTSPDGLSNMMVSFITNELVSITNEFNNKLADFSLSTAKDEALDQLVFNTYAFRRFAASKALSSGNNFKFTNSSTQDVLIPSGAKISVGEAFNEDSVVYETLADVTLPAQSDTYIAIQAVDVGREYNVTESALTNHNFEDASISCTNLYPVLNGSDREDDEELRARSLSFLESKTSHNLRFLKLQLLEVPGVYDLKFYQGYRGLGTLSVFAVADGNRSSPDLKVAIESRIQELKMPGEKIYFEEGTKVLIDMSLLLLNNKLYSDKEINDLRFSIRSLVSEEFIRSKKSNAINLSNIEDQIKTRLGSQYSFLGESIYQNIAVSYVNPSAMEARASQSLDVSNARKVIPLSFNEIPVISNITIEIRQLS